VTIEGEADHAGATPMDERSDAFAAAAAFVLGLERAAEERSTASEAAVATAGAATVEPNVRNIVPAAVRLDLDIRDTERAGMDELVERCERTLARLERTRGVETTLERYRDSEPTRMAERCLTAAARAAETRGVDAVRLYSAAMHDTANVASATDAVLLFAPSEDGISHSPREWTDWADCAAATGVLGETVRSLASR
jgi:N-carbamoyl-L-amino-acid hydrolase